MLSLIEKITNDRDYSFIFAFVKKGIQDLIIDEIRRRNPLGYVKPEVQKKEENLKNYLHTSKMQMKEKLAIEKPNEYKTLCDPNFIKKIEDSFFEEQNFDYNKIEPLF